MVGNSQKMLIEVGSSRLVPGVIDDNSRFSPTNGAFNKHKIMV